MICNTVIYTTGWVEPSDYTSYTTLYPLLRFSRTERFSCELFALFALLNNMRSRSPPAKTRSRIASYILAPDEGSGKPPDPRGAARL